MALPKLNESPQYSMTIPSTNVKVKYRPYLVKEEKVLLLAMESQDPKQMLISIANVVNACIEGDVDVDRLTTFDIEYAFLKIRSKSVGEKSNLNVKCRECESVNEYSINIDEIRIQNVNKPKDIKLTDNISLKMKWPTYLSMGNIDYSENSSSVDQMFEVLVNCIDSIKTDEESFRVAELDRQEVIDFIESMNSEQYMKLNTFVQTIPNLKHRIEFNCNECDHHNDIELNGIYDFF